MERKQFLRIGIGFAIGLLLLFLFGQAISWDRVLVDIGRADPVWFLAALAVGLSTYLAWAMVLGNVLKMADLEVPPGRIIPLFFSATFANYVTPLGQLGGEPFIALVLSDNSDVPFERGLASVITTDLLNLVPFFAISIVGIGGFLIFGQVGPLVRASLLFLLLTAFLVVIFVAFLWYERQTALRVLVFLLRPVRRVLELVRSDAADMLTQEFLEEKMINFYETVETILDRRDLFWRALGFSTLGWMLFILPIFFLSVALGTFVPILVLFFVVPISTIGGFTPLPGGLAAIEILLTELLIVFGGLGSSNALAVTLMYRIVIYWIPLGIGGLLTIWLTMFAGPDEEE